jgi:hypothetical protein
MGKSWLPGQRSGTVMRRGDSRRRSVVQAPPLGYNQGKPPPTATLSCVAAHWTMLT